MSTTTETVEPQAFSIGSVVKSHDATLGRLTRVIVDPVVRKVTHLVVEPHHRHELGHMVPIDLVSKANGTIELTCSEQEFQKLESAVETQFIENDDAVLGYQPGQAYQWPYYGLAMHYGALPIPGQRRAVTFDKVPVGEVAVRRGDHVLATDGPIGRVHGLVIEPDDHHVTHILLAEGHLFERKEVAIPISAITKVGSSGVSLSLSKKEVKALEPIDLERRPTS